MMDDELTEQTDILVLNGAFEPDQIDVEVAGGSAVALSQKDPGKQTENEDTAAVISYGPGAASSLLLTGRAGCPPGIGHR